MNGNSSRTLIASFLLALVLLAGAYFRFVGIDWGEQQYLHPDERFFVWVGTDISPVESLADYWDTANSSLNPNNRGHGFYVYGTLPLFLARYIVEAVYGHSGFAEMLSVGRPLSGFADLLIVLLVFLIGRKLFDWRAGVLGAAFSALAVMQIQQSHFYTVDNFVNLFTWLAIYLAVLIVTHKPEEEREKASRQEAAGEGFENNPAESGFAEGSAAENGSAENGSAVNGQAEAPRSWASRLVSHPFFWLSVAFGFALGCAMASKLSAFPAAALLPAAFLLYLMKLPAQERERRVLPVMFYLAVGAAVSLLTFRIFQPYAFSGPGFFSLSLNPNWVANITELRNQSAGDVDFPPALQWARRPVTFSGQNLILWGLGLPLGLLAWVGVLWAAVRAARGGWRRDGWHAPALVWGWTVLYFLWQSTAFNPTMRYQLPVYPGLALFASWGLTALYDLGRRKATVQASGENGGGGPVLPKALAVVSGTLVLALTFAWAWAFTRIYTRPVTRVEASRWIYQNIPGPVNLQIETEGEVYNQPLSAPYNMVITPEQPFSTSFVANVSGVVREIRLEHLVDQQMSAGLQELNLAVLAAPQPSLDAPPNLESLPASVDPPQVAEQQPETPPAPELPLAQAALGVNASLVTIDGSGPGLLLNFPAPAALTRGQQYLLRLENGGEGVSLPSTLILQIQNLAGQPVTQPIRVPAGASLPLELSFTSSEDGTLTGVFLSVLADLNAELPQKRLNFTLADGEGGSEARAELQGELAPLPNDRRGGSYSVALEQPFQVEAGKVYTLAIELVEGQGAVVPRGSANANETSWDDGLPLRVGNYDAYGGIYRGDLNFEMYWDDSPDKLNRFLTILNEADVLFISSSRQWGSVPRVPERYPLSREYYRRLIGCPEERSVEWCYNVAQEGTFEGELGFELVQVFDSSPNLGSLVINDQFSEEAFTVYDHPKVFIFRKSEAYDPVRVEEILSAVDVTKVIHVTPKGADQHPGTLLQLPLERLKAQLEGGTWRRLFDPDSPLNRSQILAVAGWYLSLLLLGLVVYPLLRMALPGLADRGYPLARLAGLLLFSYLAWLAGSFGLPVTRLTLSLILLALAAAGLLLALRQRDELRREWRQGRRYFLAVEGLFLAFFLLDLLIRLGNPDLWHPAHGGEKPMDFAYFNAVLKSTTFPPYDPWYAGGYLNYYYYGFVLVGMLVKWLGITPAVAYNLILPTVFMLIAMGAFSLTWNLSQGLRFFPGLRARPAELEAEANGRPNRPAFGRSFLIGLSGALGMALLGNLGTVRMLFRGFQAIAQPDALSAEAGLLTRLVWALRGFVGFLGGARMPYGLGDWYWIPSRAIPAPGDIEPITEFPFFTVLYGDPHAHLFALPIALLVLGLTAGVLLGRARWGRLRLSRAQAELAEPALQEAHARVGVTAGGGAYPLQEVPSPGLSRGGTSGGEEARGLVNGEAPEPVEGGAQKRGLERIFGGALWFLLAGLAVGSLYPTNAWDYYPYLALASLALGYAVWRGAYSGNIPRTLALSLGAIVLLAVLSRLLWMPFYEWYGLGYNKLALWKGTHTPSGSYLVHWGLFLFVIVSWMAWETIRWMAETPASALGKLRPHLWLIFYGLAVLLGLIILLTFGSLLPFEPLQGLEVHIAWLALPLAAWAGILLLRPGQPDSKRFVLFLVGTGLVETLFVEVVVLVGDIGRMNTVFKFYLQVWTFFAISAAAALGWLLSALPSWPQRWRRSWGLALGALVFCAALYPLMASRAKIEFRMAPNAPHTLDGMAYMEYARYAEEFGEMDLSQDYRAIRWMQENVEGSPVIVEANTRNLYRWGSRFSIYTGLPSPAGWEWHQQQQRALYPPNWVTERIFEIEEFYRTTDLEAAFDFLEKYDVRYIVVGQHERGQYAGPGLEKFAAANGVLWREVYREADTVIYEVL